MSAAIASTAARIDLPHAIAQTGYVLLGAHDMRRALGDYGSLADWDSFVASWDRLEPDGYMADHGHYRRRRHAVYGATRDAGVVRQAHQPHYQSRAYNTLNGGIERWFAPLEPEIGASATLRTILDCCHRTFGALEPDATDFHVEVHQFRIEAHADAVGQPTPEGVHRDGVDYVLVLMVDRTNIASGTTTIYDPGHQPLGSFTLTHPLDATFLDDHRVYHGVTAVTPLDPTLPAHRDVLVVTFRNARVSGDDSRFAPEGGSLS